MSSFNHVEKIQYTKNPADIVALREYIVFEDERAEEKYIVFKFFNQLNQRLRAIRFEVLQYDGEGALVEKSVLLHDGFEAEPNAPFVPNAKMRVNFSCKSIGVKLLFAAFDRVKWENGEFTDNSYKFDRYAETLPSAAPTSSARVQSAPAPAAKKKEKPLKYGFSIRNIFRKNLAKFPKIFNAFTILLVLGATVAAGFFFNRSSDMAYAEGFDLKVSGEYASICGYDGGQSVVTVPDKIGDYTVTEISNGAFQGGGIERVVFETQQNLLIESGAFRNCTNLTGVTASAECGTINVMENGFENCSAIELIELPTARLTAGSFYGAKQTENLCFEGFISAGISFTDLFGGGEMTFTVVDVSLSEISADLFGNAETQELIARDPDVTFGYGALARVKKRVSYGGKRNVSVSSYRSRPSYELLGGEVIAVNVQDGKFTYPTEAASFNLEKFSRALSAVRSLKLDTKSGNSPADPQTLFSYFPALEAVSLTCSSPAVGLLQSCTGINYLELNADTLGTPLGALFGESQVALETLVVNGKILSDGFFAGGSVALTRVILLNTVMLGDLTGLAAETLYLPETLVYDAALFERLRSASVGEFLFGGSKPENIGFPANSYWDYKTEIEKYFYEF